MTRRERIETDALFLLTGGSGRGWREVVIEGAQRWIAAANREAFERALQAVRLLGGRISAVPRLRMDNYFQTEAAALWVRVESGDGAARLAAFEPRPTLVLRDGDTVRHLAMWWLKDELRPHWVLRANERLSNALGGVRKAARLPYSFVPPDALSGAQTVRIERISLAMYDPNDVVGGGRPGGPLADAPDLEALRARHSARRNGGPDD